MVFVRINTSLLTGKFSWKIVTMMYRNSNSSIQSSCGEKNSKMQTEDTWQIGNTSVIFQEYSSNDNMNNSSSGHFAYYITDCQIKNFRLWWSNQ